MPPDSPVSAMPDATFSRAGLGCLDINIQKDTSITERFRTELRLEMYNAFNHPHFQRPRNTVGVVWFRADHVTTGYWKRRAAIHSVRVEAGLVARRFRE